jgi:hypothetical protein
MSGKTWCENVDVKKSPLELSHDRSAWLGELHDYP